MNQKMISSNCKQQAKELSELLFKRDNDTDLIRKRWNEQLLECSLETVIVFWGDQMIEKKQLSGETLSNYLRYLKDLQTKNILPDITLHDSPYA